MLSINRLPTVVSSVAAMSLCTLAFSAAAIAQDNERIGSPETHDPQTVVFASETRPQLDLRIGDLTQILTPEQLEQALGRDVRDLSGYESPAEEQTEQIEVRAVREQHGAGMAAIPLGFASIAWAFQNPAEAWRIFLPVELDS